MPVFKGINRIIPGAYGTVDTSGLVSAGLVAGGVLALIGKSTGGTPAQVTAYTDPVTAKNELRSGDLLDAALDAWGEGANTIYLTRVGTAGVTVTKASLDLASTSATPTVAINLTSKGYGLWANSIRAKVEAGTSSGSKLTVQLTDSVLNTVTTEIYDNIADAGAMVTAVNASSNLVVATLEGVTGDLLATVVYTNLSGGLDGASPSVGEYETAIDLYLTKTVNIMALANVTDATLHAYLKAHCVTAYGHKRPRIMVCGGAVGELVGDSGTALSAVGRAYNLNSGRAILVYPGLDGLSPAAKTTPRLAGAIAAVTVSTPLTRRVLSSSAIELELSDTDKESCIVGGVCAIEAAQSGRRVLRGITTAQDITPGVQEDPFKDINVQRTVDNVEDTIITNLDGIFIGSKGVGGVESRIISETIGILSRFKDNGDLVDFGSVSAVADTSRADVFYVTYKIKVTQAVNYIFVTTKVVNVI